MSEKSKKIVKLAVIRDNMGDLCPFGLKIPFACANSGQLITKMAPVSMVGKDSSKEERHEVALANARLLAWSCPHQRCNYAGKIFKDKDSVECNWGSNAPGISQTNLLGSPHYSKVYNNTSYDGLYAYPMGWYGDSNVSRNLYYGIYSLTAAEPKDIEKFALYINNLNNQFNSLPSEIQELLVTFASSYANNASLIKNATSLPPANDIALILKSWKEKT